MTRRRLVWTLAVCGLLGLGINFAVAAILGARDDSAVVPTGFGFVGPDFAPTVGWAGDFGREQMSVFASEGLWNADIPALNQRFRSVFGRPNGTMTRAELDTWCARLFPRWGEWAYGVSTGGRIVIAAGFPLRSFAGYVEASGSPMLSGTGGPRPVWTESGFLWRDSSRPVRGVPWVPLPLGILVNSAVFGAPLAGVSLVPAFRRARRVRRGHCPFCDYDLRGDYSRPCSECGRTPGPRGRRSAVETPA